MSNLFYLDMLRAGAWAETEGEDSSHLQAELLAANIKNEIDYKYIPVPLDSTGRPVNKGTTYYKNGDSYKADAITFYFNGSFDIYDTECWPHHYDRNEVVELAYNSQESIDADIDLSPAEYTLKYRKNQADLGMSNEKFQIVDLLRRQRIVDEANG